MKKLSQKAFFNVFFMLACCICLSFGVGFISTTDCFATANETEIQSDENGFAVSAEGVLVEYTGSETEIIIPQTVTKIGKKVFFENEDITSVVISKNVKEICNSAFDSCINLATISFSADSELEIIGDLAFYECAIETINLPKNLKSIGLASFYACRNLKEINFAKNSRLEEIDEGAFVLCEALETISLPQGLKKIEAFAFHGCANLTDIYTNTSAVSWQRMGGEKLVLPSTVVIHTMAETYTIVFEAGDVNLGVLNCHYTEPLSKTITVKNLGNTYITGFSISEGENITISYTSSELDYNEEVSFIVTTKKGLTVGTYTDDITITTNQNTSDTITIEFTVEHLYDEVNVTKNPTLNSEGSQETICDCGDIRTQRLPAIPLSVWWVVMIVFIVCIAIGLLVLAAYLIIRNSKKKKAN